ncbi:MAG: CheR family methyltransferase, partial [Candidatus Hydrogenedentota bacterium]
AADREIDAMRACGIHLGPAKSHLIVARLQKRIRELGLSTLDAYVARVKSDSCGMELQRMVEALTTNLTHFFREPRHLEFTARHIAERIRQTGRKTVRIWSAGCSSGEEPYSITITLMESLANSTGWDIRILATDISKSMIETAKAGRYPEESLDNVPASIRMRYFSSPPHSGRDRFHHVNARVRSCVHFERLNLVDPWPMRRQFDAIFCRNVMIYFSPAVRELIVKRMSAQLDNGGILCIGHSESLSGMTHDLAYIEPTIYGNLTAAARITAE